MSTNDVPGASASNSDVLSAGCWAEHDDGSLIYVKGTEKDMVVYEIYDLAVDIPMYYQDAMLSDAFKRQFSFPPVGQSSIAWTWHDKTPFPWDRVMKTFDKPRPSHADVFDQLSAAARVAESLRLRAKKFTAADVSSKTVQVGKSIMDRFSRAVGAFMDN